MSISVIIPAHNEEDGIVAVLEQLLAYNFIDEIVIVDDGSTDNTVAKISTIEDKRLILKQHPYNIGNGAAVKTGLRTVSKDIVIIMDGDGQHPPQEIPEMLKYIDDYTMVVGARNAASDAVWYRNVANTIFNYYASYLIGYNIPDLTSGFRIIHTDVVRSFAYLLPNGFSSPTTITVSLFRSGYPVKYHSFTSPARVGVSKIKPLKDGMRFLIILTRLGVFFVPLKIFLPITILLFVPSVMYIIYSLATARRFSGFGGVIFTVSILIMMVGLLAEQIATMRYMQTGSQPRHTSDKPFDEHNSGV